MAASFAGQRAQSLLNRNLDQTDYPMAPVGTTHDRQLGSAAALVSDCKTAWFKAKMIFGGLQPGYQPLQQIVGLQFLLSQDKLTSLISVGHRSIRTIFNIPLRFK